MNRNYVLKLKEMINNKAHEIEQVTTEELTQQLDEVLTPGEKNLFNNGNFEEIPCLLYCFERLDNSGIFYLVPTAQDRIVMKEDCGLSYEEIIDYEFEIRYNLN